MFASVQDQTRTFDTRFLNALRSIDSAVIRALKPFLLNRGKRVRPALVYLVNSALEHPVTEHTHRFATIVEMIHSASLFHDDVLDNASIRRGKPSPNRLLGNDLSVLAGDIMYIRALTMMNSEPSRLRKAVHNTVTGMAEAELLQGLQRFTITGFEEHMAVNRGKTANLIALSCFLGAASAGHSEMMESFREFGGNLGMAFQMMDDLLDWFGGDRLGKNRFQDLKKGHITAPLLILLKTVPAAERETLTGMITHPATARAPAAAEHCFALLERYGIRDLVLHEARGFIDNALRFLKSLSPSPYRRDLELLAQKVIERNR